MTGSDLPPALPPAPEGEDLPSSPAAERNREPIAQVLRRALQRHRAVLEIGSGTGQHGEYFAAQMPWLHWQCTEIRANLPPLARRIARADLPNLPAPQALEVAWEHWPVREHGARFDAVFTANTLHIISRDGVRAFFAGVGRMLDTAGDLLVVYGPFISSHRPTAESNLAFDAWLKARDPQSGLRQLEGIDRLARTQGLRLEAELELPANNLCLVWRRC